MVRQDFRKMLSPFLNFLLIRSYFIRTISFFMNGGRLVHIKMFLGQVLCDPGSIPGFVNLSVWQQLTVCSPFRGLNGGRDPPKLINGRLYWKMTGWVNSLWFCCNQATWFKKFLPFLTVFVSSENLDFQKQALGLIFSNIQYDYYNIFKNRKSWKCRYKFCD